MKTKHWYTIVENSGHEGENDIPREFMTYEAAVKARDRYYSASEVETLHVQIARDYANGRRSYDF